ncbi:hypothetical protein IDM30_03675 [Acinetobacter seifertii]|nr:hypothetical protein [Acinetobacter seifertii]
MQSKELDELIDQGFHLYRISWECTQKGSIEPDLYQFEAKFTDAENCIGFEYSKKVLKNIQLMDTVLNLQIYPAQKNYY